MYKEITPVLFKEKFLNNREKLELIDVREEYEFDQIKIKGSKLIPLQTMQEHLNEIDWEKEVIFICRTGARGGYIVNVLTSNGYDGKNLAGGIDILRLNCEECMAKGDLNKNYFE